jgi:hypothetical protein
MAARKVLIDRNHRIDRGVSGGDAPEAAFHQVNWR